MVDFAEVKILAIIPAYNEGERVQSVVREALTYLPVLVVDDGSTDLTAQFARQAGAEVIHQQPNQGKGIALLAGFSLALERGYQAVITLDADGQHDPAEIKAFLAAYQKCQSDLIIGKRDFKAMPWVRHLSNTIGTLLFSWALHQPVPDNQSGYRLISRRLMEAIASSREPGFEFEVEMIVTCVLKGYRLDWVPIRTIYAGEKSHIRPLHHLAKFLQITMKTNRVMRTAQRKPGA
jgi:glycosyltransferase involved in cell wall biosynthesis